MECCNDYISLNDEILKLLDLKGMLLVLSDSLNCSNERCLSSEDLELYGRAVHAFYNQLDIRIETLLSLCDSFRNVAVRHGDAS